ncbi:MAG: hypothetical protein JW828_00310 [Sedimentisphaerales bacterium]|nr:hypothetical protein [Sedimentisphaerales bacterium]
MVSLVRTMLDLHKSLKTHRTPEEKRAIKRQIAALVYELYGLTDEEIGIVEEATK